MGVAFFRLEPETIGCGERILYNNVISEVSIQTPAYLGNEPDACYCLLYQLSTSPWPEGSFVQVRLIGTSNSSGDGDALARFDSSHGENPTTDIKFL